MFEFSSKLDVAWIIPRKEKLKNNEYRFEERDDGQTYELIIIVNQNEYAGSLQTESFANYVYLSLGTFDS